MPKRGIIHSWVGPADMCMLLDLSEDQLHEYVMTEIPIIFQYSLTSLKKLEHIAALMMMANIADQIVQPNIKLVERLQSTVVVNQIRQIHQNILEPDELTALAMFCARVSILFMDQEELLHPSCLTFRMAVAYLEPHEYDVVLDCTYHIAEWYAANNYNMHNLFPNGFNFERFHIKSTEQERRYKKINKLACI